jgi:hypothetical protein
MKEKLISDKYTPVTMGEYSFSSIHSSLSLMAGPLEFLALSSSSSQFSTSSIIFSYTSSVSIGNSSRFKFISYPPCAYTYILLMHCCVFVLFSFASRVALFYSFAMHTHRIEPREIVERLLLLLLARLFPPLKNSIIDLLFVRSARSSLDCTSLSFALLKRLMLLFQLCVYKSEH